MTVKPDDGFAITPDELAEVQAILTRLLPADVRTGVFGSRARGKPKP